MWLAQKCDLPHLNCLIITFHSYDLEADFELDANELRNNITLLYMELPKNVRMQIGHQFGPVGFSSGGFFQSCSFIEVNCNNERWVGFLDKGMLCCLMIWNETLVSSFWSISNDPVYGNCFTFNAIYNNDSEDSARVVTLTGGSAALSIVLYLDQLFYTPLSLSTEAGARITIHNPKVYPMTEEYGINLKPNTASSIGFQQVFKFLQYLTHIKSKTS